MPKSDKQNGPSWKPDKGATEGNYGRAVSEAARAKSRPGDASGPGDDAGMGDDAGVGDAGADDQGGHGRGHGGGHKGR